VCTEASVASVPLLAACDDRQLLNFAPHPKQRELLETIERSQTTIACCGRRFGKTLAVAAAALQNLLLVPELDELVGRGENRFAVSVANNREQARLFVDHARSLVLGSPVLKRELVDATADRLVFRGNRILAAFPCTAKGARGWPISFLCLDEFAHHFDLAEGGPAVASRIWAAMTPSVAQFGDLGKVAAISTPLGDEGLFAELWQKAKNGEIPRSGAFHAPTSANPQVDADYLHAQEVALGADDFRREFGAEFIAGGASFIDVDRVREVMADRRELLPHGGHGWLAALDPSFSSDPTGLAIVGRDPSDRSRLVLGLAQRWLPPKRRRKTRAETERVMDEVLDGVAEIVSRYGARVVSDQHLPGTVVDELRKRGVHASISTWTATSKTQAFQALRSRIYTQRIELYEDKQLLAELGRLRTNFRGGSAVVETPRVGDSHCDLATALAAAVWEFERHGVASGELPSMREPDEKTRAISAGLINREEGFGPERDSTRKAKWYDGERSIADRVF
jgi:hypothetical protein